MASSSGQFLWQPFYPSTHRLSRKKIPCRSVAATMLHVAAMFDSEWKKMVRFDDLKSQNHQNPERRSFWIEAFYSDLRSSRCSSRPIPMQFCDWSTWTSWTQSLISQDPSRHIKMASPMASPIGSPIGSPGLR